MKVKVFISYNRKDLPEALALSMDLSDDRVPNDMDELHGNLPTTNPRVLVNTIHSAISDCSHLIVVLSETTMKSHWVPYEIGYAVAKNLYVVTYGVSFEIVPQYLRVWPNLSTQKHLDGFIARFKRKYRLAKAMIKESEDERESFYTEMKRITGQIR